MHLALIGLCPDVCELALAAADLGHSLTWYVSPDQRSAATRLLGEARASFQPLEGWESLLDGAAADGVLLASAAEHERELRADQWRRLTQAGSRILFVHPLLPDLLVYLEVDMLARDSGAVLLPYWPDAYRPEAIGLRAHAAAPGSRSPEGRWEQVGFQRALLDRSPLDVTRWFARDAVLLEYVAGPFSEITAIGADASAAAYATLAVHLHGPAEIPVRWEVARSSGEEQGNLAATGAEAELHLTFPNRTAPARATGDPAGGGRVAPPEEAAAALTAFDQLVRAGASSTKDSTKDSPPDASKNAPEDWNRSVRAMELADSIEISLRRGRRIEVHYRQMTEETSYKGLMSAAGCGLLMLGMAILVFAGMLNAVFGWRLTRFWYVPVLILFVGFLALQVLARLLVRKAD